MTGSKELAFQYDVAEGPTGLRELLDHYLVRAQAEKAFAETGHYVLYTLGDQRSLIRVDTSQVPFLFRYCDLLGRPATAAVKEAIALFLWEKCGEKDRYAQEMEARDRS